MQTQDMKISTQLRLGLGALLALMLALGALSWTQSSSLWDQTRMLHDHPFRVHQAIGGLRVDILAMHLGMRDLYQAQSDGEREAIRQGMATRQADAVRRIEDLRRRYLGPRGDVDTVDRAFVRWNTSRDESLRLVREGNKALALPRTLSGPAASAFKALTEAVDKVNAYAVNKGEVFYRGAREQYQALRLQLGVTMAVILLVGLIVAYLLLGRIQGPLQALTGAMLEYGQGRYGARCAYASGNELGQVAAAFNALAETVQVETTSRDEAARINVLLLQDLEAGEFSGRLLAELVQLTGSQVGAIYLLDEERTAYECLESVGLGGAARASFSALVREGELGVALASGQIQRIAKIPPETGFTFAAVSGDFRPREILTIPLSSGGKTPAMISLASLHEYSPAALLLSERVQGALTAWINGMQANRRAQALNDKLTAQNRELAAQKRELLTQADALGEQNVELAEQKRQLDRASRLKSTFLSNMSHELRTPLNSVIALSGVLGRRLRQSIPEEDFGYLEVIERNGKHLLALINDVLDLSRIEAGMDEPHIERFDIKELVAEVVATLEPQAREKQIALVSDIGAELPPVASDRTKCRHILQNLVANAVKFTAAGRVELSASATETSLRVAVVDTGIGIAQGQLEQIFDEFRQADESTARRHGGTGLGLSIARRYATLLQGSIAVESTPGQGSTFTLTLPLAFAPGEAAPPVATRSTSTRAAEPASLSPGHGLGQRILLVEDSEPAVVQMKAILAPKGYTIDVAGDGREALARIEVSLPDAVILDLMMPEVDGFAVLQALRADERSKGLPVLILTAKHVTAEELRFLKGNKIHQLIQKGDVSRAEILSAVAAMVRPPDAARAPVSRPPRSTSPRRPGKPLVLVVEDNPDNLLTARALLKEHYQVIEAVDGAAGLAQAQEHQPDLILMDLSLPLMDGIEVLRAIRAEARLRHIPVVALTASAMKGSREEVLAHGFDAYIAKPIDAPVLLKTLREVLDADA